MAGVAEVGRLIFQAGIGGRRVRLVIARLAERPHSIAALVEASGVDRRTVEAVLRAMGDDLVEAGDREVAIAPDRVEAYRGLGMAESAWRPYDRLLDGRVELVDRLRELIAGAPPARRALDHVPATAETVALRALWLDAMFELAGATVLCVGDHDLTSVALAWVNPRVSVTVVDVDDAVLEHVDSVANMSVRCRWADLRFGLPASVLGGADLVVTDPPYTPEGVRLFLARGLQGLAEHDQARLVLAYGFGEQPALAVKVQAAITGLGLAYEAILPGFNRYHGAQAVGARSDLYVLRPTARGRRAAEASRPGAGRRSTMEEELAIYTHGGQSLEAGLGTALGDLAAPLLDAAAGPKQLTVAMLAGPGWPSTVESLVVGLGELLSSDQVPTGLAQRGGSVAVDLRADPGGWLPRVLLAINAPRLAILVPNNHPDLVDERAQRALTDLFRAKYRLRLRRSTPGPRYAIVEAESAVLDEGERAPRAVRGVLDRAHGKVSNVWREALIRADQAAGGVLTRNEARQRIRTVVSSGVRDLLEEPVLALPRHRIADLVGDVATSAAS